MRLFVCMLFFCIGAQAQNIWSENQINDALNLIGSGQSQEAGDLVRSWGVTPHDFGLDLLSQGRGSQAMYWLQAMTRPEIEDADVNRAAYAWVLRSLGQVQAATSEATALLDSSNPLAQARANYLLAQIHRKNGDYDAAWACIRRSRELFELKDRTRGVELCDMFMESMSSSKADGPIGIPSQGEFPSDGRGS